MAALAARVSKQRAAAEGLGSNQKAVKYLGQDFQTLRQQCLDSGVLFKDPEFPACPSALGYQDLGPRSPQARGIVWKRPTELCPSPQFIIGGAKRTDICQGALGDCWLLAAIASLTLNEELLYRVVPRDQDFQDNYAGIFHFQFWQYGEWVEVVVDDRLPTKDGKLLFLHSEEGSEFWSALLEKAYAKLNGSYEALAGGSTVEGFEDFTGGISEFYDLKKPPASLYQIIWKALRSGSLLACSIDVSSAAEAEAITSQKLVKSHAYSITGVEEVKTGLGDREGMSFSDFLRQFSRLEICNLSPDSLSSKEVHKWNLVLFNGRWTRGCTAGGCQNYPATYWTNPQFEIRLDEVDDHQEEGAGEPCCTVLLGLMQKNRRRQKRMGQGMLSIGYAVYKVQASQRRGAKNMGAHGTRGDTRSPKRYVGADGEVPSLMGHGEHLPLEESQGPEGGLAVAAPSSASLGAASLDPQLDGPAYFAEQSSQPGKGTDIKFDGFDINTCREMISLMDSNGMGSLGLVEFKTLWLKIQKYLEIYREMDYNHLGTIDAHEMRAALKKAGFTLNNQVQQTIATRYAGSKLGVDFDGFVACMIRLETLFKLFRLLDKDQSGIVRLSLAELPGLCPVLRLDGFCFPPGQSREVLTLSPSTPSLGPGVLGVPGHGPIIVEGYWVMQGLVDEDMALGVGTECGQNSSQALMVKDVTSSGSLARAFWSRAASLLPS
ncbi:calpain-8 [Camelus ferus]|nr:calpain-8 [Camelus ferus]